jgi:hypothetical protein
LRRTARTAAQVEGRAAEDLNFEAASEGVLGARKLAAEPQNLPQVVEAAAEVRMQPRQQRLAHRQRPNKVVLWVTGGPDESDATRRANAQARRENRRAPASLVCGVATSGLSAPPTPGSSFGARPWPRLGGPRLARLRPTPRATSPRRRGHGPGGSRSGTGSTVSTQASRRGRHEAAR